MKLKKISFDEKGFRKLKNIEIPIAPYITAIAGHNGIGKSTILGLIANCSGLSKGEKSFFGKVFQSNFQEAFHLDYFQDYDNYHINGTKKADTPKVTVQYHVETNQDGSFIELNKICAVSIQKHAIKERLYKNHMIKVPEDKHIDPNHSLDLEDFDNNSLSSSSEPLINIWRLRIIPRTQQLPNTPEIEVLDEKLKGAGKMPIPTLYLGMSRMTPIGEFDAELIDKKTIRKMNGEDKNFIVNSFKDVLYFDESDNEITAHSFSSSKKSSYLPSFPYHSFTVSLGQDSLSSIVTALASFNYLKRTSPQTYSGGILVIDEVDAGLHPRAQEKLINLLHTQARKLNLQIILTTHSLTVIKTILSKNEHPGEKVNDVVYLQDSNFPRIMENPTYTKIKNDMLVLAPLEDKPETIKLYFEDDEALFFFKQILKYKNIIHDKDYFGKELELISLSVGCNILLDLHKGDSYFQSVILIPDNDVFSSESNRKTIEENPNICPLPNDSTFTDNTRHTERNPEMILYRFLQRKLEGHNDNFWKQMPGAYTSDYVRDRVITLTSNSNRDENKKWFQDNVNFIEKSGIIEKWCGENEKQVDMFLERIVEAVNIVSCSKSYRQNQLAK
ncbi:AAA family ATPase [Neisseria wadsworthii]|uniref:Prophage Lp2 protein 4 n=1 Tax=Neisseria wadsworthii 9715 TaxID=1030841 RepID=G4CRI1_9NEIS|nr:AAA family ATPase [Neisseria wadsworthii]EGZ45132.1 prophage Lp2 protein 4 [Neisseria wadsworthii 9715]QMT35383.1 AAA family ATPase [Neisseria wadsworthii]